MLIIGKIEVAHFGLSTILQNHRSILFSNNILSNNL